MEISSPATTMHIIAPWSLLLPFECDFDKNHIGNSSHSRGEQEMTATCRLLIEESFFFSNKSESTPANKREKASRNNRTNELKE